MDFQNTFLLWSLALGVFILSFHLGKNPASLLPPHPRRPRLPPRLPPLHLCLRLPKQSLDGNFAHLGGSCGCLPRALSLRNLARPRYLSRPGEELSAQLQA